MTEIRVPDLGDFADVPVIEVLVGPGDTVAVEQPVIVLESDKATLEVPSPAAGTVAAVAVGVGDTVSQGDLILTLEGGAEEAVEAPPVEEAPAASPSPPPETRQPVDEEAPAAPADPEPTAAAEPEPATTTIYAGPGARARARELGVDLAGLTGSGRGGRVTREDVEAVASGGGAAAPTTAAGAGEEVERVPLSRIARIAGPVLARNWATIPHVTQHDDADITDLEAFRVAANAERAEGDPKLTMVALVMKACASALGDFPTFNASLDGQDLLLKKRFHLGFAADTPQGLLVPVIRDVDRKGLREIARELTALSGTARDGTIRAEDMRGGTFTISSLGGIGGTYFTPIINAPEVAILGVSRARTRPVWIDGEFRPRLILPLSLSYDHRVVDGAAAARFTTHLAGLLAQPMRMLL